MNLNVGHELYVMLYGPFQTHFLLSKAVNVLEYPLVLSLGSAAAC